MKPEKLKAVFEKHFMAFIMEVAALMGVSAKPAPVEEEEGEEEEVAVVKKKKKPAPVEEEDGDDDDGGVTLVSLRNKGMQLINDDRQDELSALCKKHGAANLTKLDPAKYAVVDKALDKLLAV